MKRKTIIIDTSDLKEGKTVIFYTKSRVLCKTQLRRCLNQMFEFILKDEEDYIYFEFEHDKDPFIFKVIKQFGNQLLAFFPEKYYYDAYFVSSNYKLNLKYKLSVARKNHFELKLQEECPKYPIVAVVGTLTSDKASLLRYDDKVNFRQDFRHYCLSLLISTIINMAIAVLWFLDDLDPQTFHRFIPFVIPTYLGAIAVVHTFRCLSVGIKQFLRLKREQGDLSCFTKLDCDIK